MNEENKAIALVAFAILLAICILVVGARGCNEVRNKCTVELMKACLDAGNADCNTQVRGLCAN